MPDRLVISNTSPLLYLHQAGQLDLLKRLYGRVLSRDRYEKPWADLFAQDVLALGGDLAADKRNRTGVSFNHVEVVLGDPDHAGARMRFDYLLPQLELPENQQRQAVVEILKKLAS